MQILLLKSLNLINIFLQNLSVTTPTTELINVSFHLHADVIPVHKEKDKYVKKNYRPVSILTNISRVYEELLYNKLYSYFDNILSQINAVFEKGTVLSIAF